jgi:hypothetical protein
LRGVLVLVPAEGGAGLEELAPSVVRLYADADVDAASIEDPTARHRETAVFEQHPHALGDLEVWCRDPG